MKGGEEPTDGQDSIQFDERERSADRSLEGRAGHGESGGGAAALSFPCPNCERAFASNRGLGQHRRKQHADVFHMEAAEAAAGRRQVWSDQEEQLLIEREANFVYRKKREGTRVTVKMIVEHLCATPGLRRSEFAVSSRRKRPSWKEEVEQQIRNLTRVGREVPADATRDSERNFRGPTREAVLANWSRLAGEGTFDARAILDNPELLEPEYQRWCTRRLRLNPQSKRKGARAENSTASGPKEPTDSEEPKSRTVSTQTEKFGKGRGMKKRPSKEGKPLPRSEKSRNRRLNFARFQKEYASNRTRTIRALLDGRWGKPVPESPIHPNDQYDFWRGLFESESLEDNRPMEAGRLLEGVGALLEPGEVKEALKDMPKGTSPGPDGVKVADLSPGLVDELTAWFNIWLYLGRPPESLSQGRTVLIPKRAKPEEAGDFRPITVSSVVLRLMHKVFAERLRNAPLSNHQRGFRPFDGVAMNVFLVKALIQRAKVEHRPLYLVFLDVKKAFDSVSHRSLLRALRRLGFPPNLIRYIEGAYAQASTTLACDPEQRKIRFRSGVLQGDPLSGILFNAVLDMALAGLPENLGVPVGDQHVCKAMFADDTVLVSSGIPTLQRILDDTVESLATVGLSLNSSKCMSLGIGVNARAKTTHCVNQSFLTIGGAAVPTLGPKEYYKYLGVKVGMEKCKNSQETLRSLENQLRAASSSLLKPQQKLYVLRIHILPAFLHCLVLGDPTPSLLGEVDKLVRRYVKRWLHLPKDCPNGFIHTDTALGGLGVACMATKIARLRLQRTERMRNDRDLVIKELASVEYVMRTWAVPPCPTDDNGRLVTTKFSEAAWWKSKLVQTCDGRDLDSFENSHPAGSRWLKDPFGGPKYTGEEFIRAVHVRANCLATPERRSRGRRGNLNGTQQCPRCHSRGWCGLGHIIQECGETQGLRIKRHDHATEFVVRAIERRKGPFKVFSEPRIQLDRPTEDGRRSLKPDIVCLSLARDRAIVIDTQIHSCAVDASKVREIKRSSYNRTEVKAWCWSQLCSITGIQDPIPPNFKFDVEALALNWRGAISVKSVEILKVLGVSRFTMDLLSVRTLNSSHGIFRTFMADPRTR